MKLRSNDRGSTTVVTALEDRLDAAVAIQFKDNMREVAESSQNRIVLDLSQVEFLDSSGLGAVVATLKMMGPYHRFELAGLTPSVKKVFRLTRMDTVFTIHTHVDAAFGDTAQAS